MKSLLMAGWFVSTMVSAAPVVGVLTEDGVTDTSSSYRCQLPAGKGDTIKITVDTDQKTLDIELGGNLSHPKHVDTLITGPYTLVRQREAFKNPSRSYDLTSRGYDFSLKFTEAKATPILTLVWTGREYLCQ